MAGRRGGNGKQKPPFVFPRVESVARPTGAVRQLRYWVQTYQSAQKFRIVGGNRLSAWERQVDTAEEVLAPSAGEMQTTAQQIEAQAYGEIKRLLKTMPIWTDWLRHVKGIDVALGGALLALLLPPRADRTVASWFKAAGLDVVNAPPRSDPGLSTGKAVVSDQGVDSDHGLASESNVGSGAALVSESTLGPGAAVASDGCVGSGIVLASDQRVSADTSVASGTPMGSGEQVADETGEAAAPAKRRHPAETDPLAPHLPRFTKGEQPTWHPQLRKTLYLVGESLVRSGGYYREFYDDWKAGKMAKHTLAPRLATLTADLAVAYREYRATTEAKKPSTWPQWLADHWQPLTAPVAVVKRDNPGWAWETEPERQIGTILCIRQLSMPWFLLDRIARWKAVKLLLTHCWAVWCEMDGIPCGMPYAIGILGHDAAHYLAPPRPELFDGKM